MGTWIQNSDEETRKQGSSPDAKRRVYRNSDCDTLFLTHPVENEEYTEGPEEEIPELTEAELKVAITSMKNKKAPRPDGIHV